MRRLRHSAHCKSGAKRLVALWPDCRSLSCCRERPPCGRRQGLQPARYGRSPHVQARQGACRPSLRSWASIPPNRLEASASCGRPPCGPLVATPAHRRPRTECPQAGETLRCLRGGRLSQAPIESARRLCGRPPPCSAAGRLLERKTAVGTLQVRRQEIGSLVARPPLSELQSAASARLVAGVLAWGLLGTAGPRTLSAAGRLSPLLASRATLFVVPCGGRCLAPLPPRPPTGRPRTRKYCSRPQLSGNARNSTRWL